MRQETLNLLVFLGGLFLASFIFCINSLFYRSPLNPVILVVTGMLLSLTSLYTFIKQKKVYNFFTLKLKYAVLVITFFGLSLMIYGFIILF